MSGFVFPAFHDRGSDIHSVLYYSKNSEELQDAFVESLLGCPLPLSADTQKETFCTLVEETLGDDCVIDTVKNIHEKLGEFVEEHKEDDEIPVLGKNEVKNLLSQSGIPKEKLDLLDQHYESNEDAYSELLADNVMSAKTFLVKTPDVVIKVNPQRTDLVNTQVIDGKKCLVIELDGGVEVNGIHVRP
jgi:transcriptional regulator of met regulon